MSQVGHFAELPVATMLCPSEDTEYLTVRCHPEVVKRSHVLRELLTTDQVDEGPSIVRLPFDWDTFMAWHNFGQQRDPSVETLSRVLQV
jgi:hypothetical protein